MIIAFTGTPGTGKTTLAKGFAKRNNYKYIDVNEFSKQHDLFGEYDKQNRCFLVDTNRLAQVLGPELKGDVAIDSHLSHYLPQLDLCVVTTCSDLKELQKRLEKRGYSKEKVRDNLDAEIFSVCLVDAIEMGHRVLSVDTARLSEEECLEKIEAGITQLLP